MLIASLLLVVCVALTYAVHRRDTHPPSEQAPRHDVKSPLSGANGFAHVLRDRYLLLFAGLIFVLNWVTKTGDYVLDLKLLDAAHAAALNHDVKASLYVGPLKARDFARVTVLVGVDHIRGCPRVI